MFVLDDILIASALGGGISGLMGKDPIKGAAMGALGGMAAPAMGGLLSQAPAATAAAAAPAPAGALTQTAAPGIMESVKTVSDFAKPVGNIFSAANAAQGLLAPKQQPVQASPVMQNAGSPALTGLTQQFSAMEQQRMQDDAQRRARRASLLGG
jgi:hypothetical protein